MAATWFSWNDDVDEYLKMLTVQEKIKCYHSKYVGCPNTHFFNHLAVYLVLDNSGDMR